MAKVKKIGKRKAQNTKTIRHFRRHPENRFKLYKYKYYRVPTKEDTFRITYLLRSDGILPTWSEFAHDFMFVIISPDYLIEKELTAITLCNIEGVELQRGWTDSKGRVAFYLIPYGLYILQNDDAGRQTEVLLTDKTARTENVMI